MAEELILRRKEKKSDGEEDEGGVDKDFWMITFSDLLQLLITFFVLLISMASMDDQTVKEMFSVFTGGMGELNYTSKHRLTKPSEIPVVIPTTVTVDALIALLRFDPSDTKLKEKTDMLIQNMIIDRVEIRKRGSEFSLVLSDEAVFEEGQIEIKEELKPVLDNIIEILSLSNNTITIEGHTDDIPTVGRFLHTNWELSAARATSVLRYMMENGTIGVERMQAKGMASFNPKTRNISENYRKRNRRVEIVIKQFDKEPF